MKRFLYLLCALAFCLALTPSTALAADTAPAKLYVGDQQVIVAETVTYWTTTDSGKLTRVYDATDNSDWNVKYDPNTATLTLNGATISGSYDEYNNPFTAGIYALAGSAQSVSLTIQLTGNNTITGDYGIYVDAQQGYTLGANASLNITGDGSLKVSGSTYGIFVKSGTGDASLTINGASVKANTTSTYSGYAGVCVQSGSDATNSPQLSLAVDGGNLTTSASEGNDGIQFYVGSSQATNATVSLTVTDNAIVDARTGGISASGGNVTPTINVGSTGTSGGIVFDGSTGTVYGDVTLDESLTVNEGESLTIPEDSTLYTNGNLTNNGTIINKGGLTGGTDGTGTIETTPTITKQPESQTVAENATAKFTVEATGGNLSYQWQQSTDGTAWTDISGANSDTYTTEAAPDMNGRQYRCKVSNNAGSVTSEPAILTVNQHEHEWGEPAWTWSEDGKTATATFTCAECDETQNVEATVTSTVKTDPTCTENGVTEYTATVKHDGTTYTATKNVADIPATGHDWGEDGHCTICDTIKPGFMPEIIQGDEATWTKGGGQPLSFTSNAAYADFQEARVDGQTLDPAHYTVEQGSTIVTLKADYLETLNPGEHTLDIVSATGTATATFTITAKETQQPTKPADTDRTPAKPAGSGERLARTGSGTIPALLMFTILMAAGLVLGTFVLRRGRR